MAEVDTIAIERGPGAFDEAGCAPNSNEGRANAKSQGLLALPTIPLVPRLILPRAVDDSDEEVERAGNAGKGGAQLAPKVRPPMGAMPPPPLLAVLSSEVELLDNNEGCDDEAEKADDAGASASVRMSGGLVDCSVAPESELSASAVGLGAAK